MKIEDIKTKESSYKILLETFGEDLQYQFAIEEMGKLLQAICKLKRKIANKDQEDIDKAIENLKEEVADVTICMEQLAFILGEEDINNIKKYKIERALKRAEKKIAESIKNEGNNE